MNPYSTVHFPAVLQSNPSKEAPEWCFVHPRTNEPSAPVLVRDLEVLWETGEINLQTLVWKQGMTEWKKIVDIPDLHRKILDDTYVPINPINKPLLQTVTKEDVRLLTQQPQKVGNILGNAAKKDDPEEELESLEKKFEKLKQNFYQSADGLYHVMDPVTKQWKTQTEAPNIEVLDEETLENLIFGINNEDGEDGEKKNKNKNKNKNAKTQMVDLDTLTDEQIKKMEKNKKKAKKQAEKKRQKWYDAKVNNCLYVKGLPDDITHEELKTFFSKAGVIRLDLEKGNEKIKIYTDDKGRPKGDALISFVRGESVDLAIEMLNETEIRPKYKVLLDRAQFEQKGDYKPRKKLTEDKIALIKTKTDQERLLSWNDEEAGEGLKIVIILNMFGPEDVETEENFEENLRQDIIEECEAKLGPVQRVTVYENNPEGAVQIKFKEDAAAEKCIQLMNGRFFGGRELRCFYWDGKTDYRRTRETTEDEQRRLDDFGKWIEAENEQPQGE